MSERDKGKDIRHLTDPLTVKHAPREVIESKLLAALDDEGKVAIVASETDLDLLIDILKSVPRSRDCARARILHDLRTLRHAAFGRF